MTSAQFCCTWSASILGEKFLGFFKMRNIDGHTSPNHILFRLWPSYIDFKWMSRRWIHRSQLLTGKSAFESCEFQLSDIQPAGISSWAPISSSTSLILSSTMSSRADESQTVATLCHKHSEMIHSAFQWIKTWKSQKMWKTPLPAVPPM